MATTFSFKVAAPLIEQSRVYSIIDQALERIHQLERNLTEYWPESPVYQFNRSATHQPIVANDDVLFLLQESELIETSTEQAFSVLAKSAGVVPRLRKGIGIDFSNQTIWKKKQNSHLGFGAIGKGYAVDQAAKILSFAGLSDFLISAGGSSLFFSGSQDVGVPWTVGWALQSDSERYLGIEFDFISKEPMAVGVSSLMEQGSHIKNPRGDQKSYGVFDPKLSTWVIASQAAHADAWSTALFVNQDRFQSVLGGAYWRGGNDYVSAGVFDNCFRRR